MPLPCSWCLINAYQEVLFIPSVSMFSLLLLKAGLQHPACHCFCHLQEELYSLCFQSPEWLLFPELDPKGTGASLSPWHRNILLACSPLDFDKVGIKGLKGIHRTDAQTNVVYYPPEVLKSWDDLKKIIFISVKYRWCHLNISQMEILTHVSVWTLLV